MLGFDPVMSGRIWVNPFLFEAYEGGGSLATRASHRLRRTLQRGLRVIEAYDIAADLARPLEGPRARIAAEIRRASAEDLALFRRKGEEARANFAAGDACFIALHEGRLIYSRWVVRRPVLEGTLGVKVEPAADEGYLYDAHTEPRYRGLGLHGAVTAVAMNWLREEGVARATGIVLRTNLPARRVLARLGFAARARYRLVEFAGRRNLTVKPCHDRLAP